MLHCLIETKCEEELGNSWLMIMFEPIMMLQWHVYQMDISIDSLFAVRDENKRDTTRSVPSRFLLSTCRIRIFWAKSKSLRNSECQM